ncbi:MAG: serine hydrolase domain-containing protein, partial [Longimicrobiales bacterium]
MRPAHRRIPRSRPTRATPHRRPPILEVVALFLAAHALPAQEAPAFTDPDRAAKVRALGPAAEAMFGDFFRERDVPGLAWGVVLDGELILSGAFGSADLDGGVPADTRSLFRIASMSKSFTALAILQLRDRGLLRLDAPASDYLPEMEGLRLPTDDAPVITVRNLLTHSAGFPEDNPWGDRQLADTDEELLALVEDGISFSRAPGVAYEYSNTGFALLGQIVQRVSGMEFQEYMRRHVFEPLGMDATVWEFEDAPAERLALGYDRSDGDWVQVPHEHHGAFGAMGGLITSIEDFAAYAALHLSAWSPRDDPDEGPLRRSSLREMHQPATFSSLQPGY